MAAGSLVAALALTGVAAGGSGSARSADAPAVFEIASLSKGVGATVVARAVDQGKVAWTDPIVKYLPDFALSDLYVTEHVTIEDVYAHRSGLPAHAGDLLEDLGFDRTQVLERLRAVPLQPFRAVYAYTNFGLTAGAEAVARASSSARDRGRRSTRSGSIFVSTTRAGHESATRARSRSVPAPRSRCRRPRVWASSCSPTVSRSACPRPSPRSSWTGRSWATRPGTGWRPPPRASRPSATIPRISGRRRLPTPETRADSVRIGTYESDFSGTMRVVERNGGLVMLLGPQSMAFPLEHWTGDTFAYDTVGENASGRQAVTFTVSGSRASEVTVTDLNDAYGADAGLGVFRRM